MSPKLEQRPAGALGRALGHELRVLSADGSLWAVCVLLGLLCTYAVGNGLLQTNARDTARDEALAEQTASEKVVGQRLRRVIRREELPTPWSNPADPSLVGGGLVRSVATLPTLPLAPFATGQSDLLPTQYKVTTQSRVEFMYDSEIENPWNLLVGCFDLAFVITFLVPLVVLGWSYNLITSEREQGTLRLLLSQPIRLRTVVLAKVSVRAAVVLGCVVMLPVLLLLAGRSEARTVQGLVSVACWVGLVSAYSFFWFALAVLVDGVSRSSALSALSLVSCWVVSVLVLPVVLGLGVTMASPAPSRAELATQTRLITVASLTRFSDKFGSDYRHVHNPELLLPNNGRFDVSDRMKAFFLASRELDVRLERVLAAFDLGLEGQQQLVDRFGVLSPAILVQEGMAAISGNGTHRYRRFQAEVIAYHAEWRQFFESRIDEGVAITVADLARLPRFHWQASSERSPSEALWGLLKLTALAGMLGGAAWWMVRRQRIA